MSKKWFFFLLLPLFLHASLFDWFDPLSPKAKRARDLLENIDPLVEKAMQDHQVPGLAIGVIVDGHVVYAKGFGYRDLEKKLPVTPDTLFAIGSCTKAFTTFVIGNMVDEGVMGWDQNVIDILPEFRLWDQYATQNLTIRDLLTHRSGMPRHDWMWYNASLTRPELLKRLRYLEPSSDIRERYQYGNLMYFTAGYALERAAGKSWEELVSERILKPLKMNHTNFSVQEMQKAADYALPYKEKNEQLKRMGLRDFSLVGPAASMNSNVIDLMHWIKLHLNQGVCCDQALISPTALQEMHAPQVIIPGAPETKESQLYAYGIGWSVLAYRGHYFLSHDGALDGFTSVIGFLPKEGMGLVILSNKNLSSLPRYLSLHILDRALELPPIDWLEEGAEGIRKNREALKGKKLNDDMSRKKGTVPSHPLEDYAGEYEHPGYGVAAVELIDGKLQLTYNGVASALDHWHYDVFAIGEESQEILVSLEGTKVKFTQGLNGNIEQMAIPYEPQSPEIVFKKKPKDAFSGLSYLRRFVGPYEIYGYTVEVIVRDNLLVAIIPGQPVYELIPKSLNEFDVKSLTGSTVQFILNEASRVQEVRLHHPYGTFSAWPKN